MEQKSFRSLYIRILLFLVIIIFAKTVLGSDKDIPFRWEGTVTVIQETSYNTAAGISKETWDTVSTLERNR